MYVCMYALPGDKLGTAGYYDRSRILKEPF